VAPKLKVRKTPTLSGAEPRLGLGAVQLGQSGLKRSYGYIYEELLPQLAGRKAVSVYQEMYQNSSVIGAVIFAIDMFMRKVAWRVEPASDSKGDKQRAKFLESCKDDMEMSWPDFISEVNSMLIFGWSWFEICYKQRFNDVVDEFGTTASQWNDGLYGWEKLMPIAQESWWRWDFSPQTGKTIGMWQRPAPDYSERYLPIGKSLHFRTKSWKDNPEGVSLLRSAYRAWYFLKRIEEIEAIGVERDLAGIPIATVPAEMLGENASEADQAMVASVVKLVQNVRRDEQEGIVWPQAYDQAGHELYTFKLLTSGGTRQFPTDTIISRYESRIAMTMLADFLLLGNDATNNGSYALSTSKASMFQSALETFLNDIENELNNRAVPLLFRMNGLNNGPYPKFRHDIVQKPTLTDLATLVSSMAGAGAQLFPDMGLENHLREFAKLPIREENPANEAIEDQIINQQLDTLLASSAAEEDIAQRTARDANAEGIVPAPQGSIVERMDPITMKPPAGGASGAPGAPSTGQQSPAQGAAQATATNRAAKVVGTGGKQKGSAPGAPTKSTGPVKSTQPPAARRTTIATRASQNAPAKSTGGLKNRSVAKTSVLAKVKKQMSSDFPERYMDWMDDASWTGPVRVPVTDIDFSDEKRWAAHHEQAKVDHFAKNIRSGVQKPVVVVRAPGHSHLRVVDGHHHVLAYKQAGVDPVVFIGKVAKDSGPWETMHSHQLVSRSPDGSGYEPGDKGGAVRKSRLKLVGAGGVAVKAADTGRVLMLQRGLDHSDPASGKWEFPGGRREVLDESPESAGIREWQEETGMKLPKGEFTGHWSSPDNVYHGLVLTVPHEHKVPINGARDQVTNPDDPDGDNVESLAWWDPKHLSDDHPALRKELRGSLDRVHDAIKSDKLEKARNKLAKAEVHYRPSIGSRKCENCVMFRGPGSCTLVKGAIDPEDVCDRFEAEKQPVKVVVKSFSDTVDALSKSGPPVTVVKVKYPMKKCDYCQNPEKNRFMQGGSILHRTCNIHVPQGRAEVRWTQNNQVSPVNGNPNAPFPRVITQ
jgi:8-oxo-dGTP pyrophosphatase MutT (NUDIX family)